MLLCRNEIARKFSWTRTIMTKDLQVSRHASRKMPCECQSSLAREIEGMCLPNSTPPIIDTPHLASAFHVWNDGASPRRHNATHNTNTNLELTGREEDYLALSVVTED